VEKTLAEAGVVARTVAVAVATAVFVVGVGRDGASGGWVAFAPESVVRVRWLECRGEDVEYLLRGPTIPVVRDVAVTAASAGPGAAVDDLSEVGRHGEDAVVSLWGVADGSIRFG
jgi:hypothetical protein